jgi:hypothetical protein
MSTVAEAISPELVLVCPELRQQALALLPERDPYAFLAAVAAAPPTARAAAVESGKPALATAAAAYFLVALGRSVASMSTPLAILVALAFALAR